MPNAHPFQTDDPRLVPIKDKVLAGVRLDEGDALVLYGTGDILAVGWLANWVRERKHGDKAYFNVNRHINPTNVCVAACRLCAFGRKKDSPGAYTMALEEAFEIEIPDDDAEKILTVKQAIDYIQAHAKA